MDRVYLGYCSNLNWRRWGN